MGKAGASERASMQPVRRSVHGWIASFNGQMSRCACGTLGN